MTGQGIQIIGAGEIAQAIQHLLTAAGHRSSLWEGLPADGSAPPPLEPRIEAADVVVFCVPVSAHTSLAPRVAAALPRNALCMTLAKGLDERARTAAEILAEALGGQDRLAVLYGPMIAEELVRDRLGYADVGCIAGETFRQVQSLFAGSFLRLTHSTDILGTSWSVVLKNVYVPVIGACDELELGDNVRGMLVSTAFRELSGIVRELGGERETPYGLAGLGDFVGSATSAGSLHRDLGRRLARGDLEEHTGEGLNTLAQLAEHPRFDEHAYPLLRLIRGMAEDPTTAASTLRDFARNWPS